MLLVVRQCVTATVLTLGRMPTTHAGHPARTQLVRESRLKPRNRPATLRQSSFGRSFAQ